MQHRSARPSLRLAVRVLGCAPAAWVLARAPRGPGGPGPARASAWRTLRRFAKKKNNVLSYWKTVPCLNGFNGKCNFAEIRTYSKFKSEMFEEMIIRGTPLIMTSNMSWWVMNIPPIFTDNFSITKLRVPSYCKCICDDYCTPMLFVFTCICSTS